MDILSNKEYKSYPRLSRYSIFPTFFNKVDNKRMYGTTAYLSDKTTYTAHKVKKGDTYDSLALDYYNNPSYFWVICSFNHIQDPFEEPIEGETIRIPAISSIEYDI